jgi:hypothetical protein
MPGTSTPSLDILAAIPLLRVDKRILDPGIAPEVFLAKRRSVMR